MTYFIVKTIKHIANSETGGMLTSHNVTWGVPVPTNNFKWSVLRAFVISVVIKRVNYR